MKSAVWGVILSLGYLWAAETGVISGFVRDASCGDFLGYANVYLADNSLGAAAKKDGYYLLSGVPAGEHTLVCSMIGYREERALIHLELGRRLRHDFYLEPEPLSMQEVNVTAERARFEHEVDVGVQHIDIGQIRRLPTLGEEDLFRALEMLPGVISVSDFTSALYIRGGTADQNLVLLDGIPIYNPYHLLGAFSTFIIEPLKDAELYTGGFPARYGGAISSVLDIEMRDGNREELKASGELGLLSSKLTVEGPLPWLEGSWIVAGRRTYLDAATWAIEKIFNPESFNILSSLADYFGFDTEYKSFYFPYHFYDLQAKVGLDIGKRSRLSLLGFLADDVFRYQDSIYVFNDNWGNAALGLGWRYLFSPKLFSNLGFNITRYRDKDRLEETEGWCGYNPWDSTLYWDTTIYIEESDREIAEASLRWDVSWFPMLEHSVGFGAEARIFQINKYYGEGSYSYYSEGYSYLEKEISEYGDSAWIAAIYVEDKWEPSPFWVIESGLRGEYFNRGSYFRLSPRLGMKRRLSADWALKAGSGLYYQYLYVPYPSSETDAKLPLEFFQAWLLADSAYPPLQSALFTFGSEYLLPRGSISLEFYYKDLRNIREWASTTLGRGYSCGAELLLKCGSSWLGYSYSVTRYRFDDDWFYPLHDSRHNVNLALALPLGKGWQVSAAWVYGSGFPFTGVLGWYQYVYPDGRKDWKFIRSLRGEERYPDYHRLDLGLLKNFKLFKRCDACFYIQVLNVYSQDNVLSYFYGVDYNTGATFRIPVYMIPWPVPSLGIRVKL